MNQKTNSKSAIFLDIDGVLNGAKTSSRAPSGWLGIANSKLDIFSKFYHNLKDENGEKYQVILSSTWREMIKDINGTFQSPDDLDGRYMLNKFAKFWIPIHGITRTDTPDSERGAQIDDYVRSNGIDNYIVIDDIKFADFDEYGVTKHFIQTSEDVGVRADVLTKALAELNEYGELVNDYTLDGQAEQENVSSDDLEP